MAKCLVIVESPAKVKTIKMCIRDRMYRESANRKSVWRSEWGSCEADI